MLASRRAGGIYGIVFVCLLFASAAMASLPTSADSAGAIAKFYRDHSSVVTLQQAIGVIALVPLVAFGLVLRANRWLRPALLLLVLIELVTNVVPLAILASPGSSRTLTTVEDGADSALFIASALFLIAATLEDSVAVRVAAYIAAAACIIRASASPFGINFLDQVAPLTLIAVILLISVRLLMHQPDKLQEQSGDPVAR